MTLAQNVHVRTTHAARTPVPVAGVIKTHPAAPKRINDVVRVTHHSLVVTPRPQKQSPILAPTVHQPKPVMDVTRTTGHVKAHKTQPAQTLMRSAVKRPAAGLKRRTNAQTRTDVLIKSPQFEVQPKASIHSINPKRQNRAVQTPRSNRINRFAPEQASWFRQQVKTPLETDQLTTAAAKSPDIIRQTRSEDIFHRALANATAHEQTHVKHKPARPLHHQTASLVVLSLAVLVITGFFIYQHQANITLRFASAKAGFHATLPSYQPSGYAAGKFHYSAGSVAVQYAKPGTSRNYSLSQSRPTNPSQLASTLAPKNASYQTLQEGNNTIYIYNNGNAAWLKGGTLYQIKSNGNLSTTDILSIATSV